MNKHLRSSIIWAATIPAFFVLGQLLGYFIFWALGYEEGQSILDGPLMDRFIVSIPVGALMLTPCIQAVRYGFAAKRAVGKKAFPPTLIAALAGSFIFFTFLMSLLGLA